MLDRGNGLDTIVFAMRILVGVKNSGSGKDGCRSKTSMDFYWLKNVMTLLIGTRIRDFAIEIFEGNFFF